MGYTERSNAKPFTPKELLELPRPSAGVANSEGDLALVVVSKYSFDDKKHVRFQIVLRSFTLTH